MTDKLLPPGKGLAFGPGGKVREVDLADVVICDPGDEADILHIGNIAKIRRLEVYTGEDEDQEYDPVIGPAVDIHTDTPLDLEET